MGNVRLRLKDKATGFNYDFVPEDGALPEDGILEIPSESSGILLTMDMLVDSANTLVNGYNNVDAPVILSPTNNETNIMGWFIAKEFVNKTNMALTYKGITWQIANDINFDDIIYSIEMNYGYTLNPNLLSSNKVLYVRCQYILDKLVSDWSEPVKFTTGPAFVSTPSVTVLEDLAGEDILRSRVTTSNFNITGMSGTHTSTTWRVIDTETSDVVEEILNGDISHFDMNLALLTKGKVYKVEAIHNASSAISLNGYTYYKFDRNVISSGPGEDIDIEGEDGDTFYFGEIGIGQLDGTYNYRGEWGVNSGRPAKDYVVDEQVTYNDVLYRCLKDHTNIEPGTDETTWVVDTRNGLPTGKWLLDHIGIGYGLTDNNADTRSSGSVKLGNLKNNDQGWLRCLYNGKTIYIAKKPFVDTVAWTDIAKREAESGKRTVRIGQHLYYVRLMTQDEFTNCLVKTTDGTLGNYTPEEISLADKCWLHDATEGAYRARSNGGTGIESADAKSRTGAYRPVLEYIPEGEEPYNNIKSGIPTATNENFQYDFYTDTGYFGHVPSTSLIGSTALATTAGLTAGTAQNDTTGYFKFYWHGILLYVCKQTIRHNISWDSINTANVVFGKDMGGTGLKTITVGSNTYAVQLLLGADKSPSTEATGHNSQWNELIYRVNTYIPKLGDTSIATAGMQIGANWVNYTDAEMSVNYTVGGNGCYNWCQEIYVPSTTLRISRGYNRLSTVSAYNATYTNSYTGVRLVLRVL